MHYLVNFFVLVNMLALSQRDFVKRVEEIVQFLLQHDGLTTEDLDALWGAQNGQHESVVRNIFGLVKKCHSKRSDVHSDLNTGLNTDH